MKYDEFMGNYMHLPMHVYVENFDQTFSIEYTISPRCDDDLNVTAYNVKSDIGFSFTLQALKTDDSEAIIRTVEVLIKTAWEFS